MSWRYGSLKSEVLLIFEYVKHALQIVRETIIVPFIQSFALIANMRKLQLLLLFLLLFCEIGLSQAYCYGVLMLETNDMASDSTNLSPNNDFEKRIKLNPINESGNEIEIRFYKLEEVSNTRDLQILELKNNTWKGTQYSESNYPTLTVKKFKLEADKGFPEVFQMLVRKNLTNLPSQDGLTSMMKKYASVADKRGKAEQIIFVNDGYSYTVEYKIEEKYRIYTFSNPEIYAAFYNHVQELKDYTAIKNIFATELKSK